MKWGRKDVRGSWELKSSGDTKNMGPAEGLGRGRLNEPHRQERRLT